MPDPIEKTKTSSDTKSEKTKSHSIVFLILFILVFAVLFMSISGKQKEKDARSSYEKNLLANVRAGNINSDVFQQDTPYNRIKPQTKTLRVRHAGHGDELTEPKPPFGYGTLEITNNRKKDIIVYLADAYTGNIKRSVYVWGGEKLRCTLQQIGPGVYLVYYIAGTGWDNNSNRFTYASSPVYVGQYHEFVEKTIPQGVEVTNERIVIDPPEHTEDDVVDEKIVKQTPTTGFTEKDYYEMRKYIEREKKKDLSPPGTTYEK